MKALPESKTAFPFFVLVVLICLMRIFWPHSTPAQPIATLQVDGEVVRIVALATAPDEAFPVTTPSGGEMTFEVRDHTIAFIASSCPDKICVHNGFLSMEGQTAICLPNRT